MAIATPTRMAIRQRSITTPSAALPFPAQRYHSQRSVTIPSAALPFKNEQRHRLPRERDFERRSSVDDIQAGRRAFELRQLARRLELLVLRGRGGSGRAEALPRGVGVAVGSIDAEVLQLRLALLQAESF